MRVAFEEDDILADMLCREHGGIGVAELQRHRLVHIRRAVDGFSIGGNRLLDRHDGAKFGKLRLDQLERLIGYPLVGGRDRRNRIADITDLFARERLLVLAHR